MIDADKVVHDLYRDHDELKEQLFKHFGLGVLRDGEIDRSYLGQIVFQQPEKLEFLNQLVHPWVRNVLLYESGQANARKEHLILMVPLLVETGWHRRVDEMWLVSCSHETQLERLISREGLTVEDAQRRIRSQYSDEQRRAYASAVIENDGGLEELKRQVKEIWEQRLLGSE